MSTLPSLLLLLLVALPLIACAGPAGRGATGSSPADSMGAGGRAALDDYLAARAAEAPDAARRPVLDRLAAAVAARPGAALLFVCTHNSRRSQMAQVWAHVAARHLGLDDLTAYSGGTEVTACNRRTVDALERAGLTVARGDGPNPVHRLAPGPEGPWIECWSKRMDDPANPRADFVAVMTCSDADAACPYVPGAAARVALPYEDPKAFDDGPREAAAYDERCADIAREMLYVLTRVRDLRAGA